jgi:hypothetical protein
VCTLLLFEVVVCKGESDKGGLGRGFKARLRAYQGRRQGLDPPLRPVLENQVEKCNSDPTMKIWDLSQETYFGPSNGTVLSYEFRRYRSALVVAKVRALSFSKEC